MSVLIQLIGDLSAVSLPVKVALADSQWNST